jgi:hypothetical protein
LYHLFIVNGKKEEENKENCELKKVVPIDVPMIAIESFEKTVVERHKTGTLSKSRAQALLELVKNVFRKNQSEEDIDKELEKLQEKRSALLEQIAKCDKNIEYHERLARNA